jgi:hypothetical protein
LWEEELSAGEEQSNARSLLLYLEIFKFSKTDFPHQVPRILGSPLETSIYESLGSFWSHGRQLVATVLKCFVIFALVHH